MRALLLLVALSFAQAQPTAFEVVSIKLASPDARSTSSSLGGPGTRRPGTWTCQNASLRNIVNVAYDVRDFQLITPEWMNEPRFDIAAKVPEGATAREHLFSMLQKMLADRFALKVHREQKEVLGYELTIGKNGIKFKESPEPQKDPPPYTPGPTTLAADGFPAVPAGITGGWTTGNRARFQWFHGKIDRLVREIGNHVDRPVVDATGLTAVYDFALFWVPDPSKPDAPAPTLFAALQDQLGLKLESKKVTIPIVIVESAARVPTEN